MINKLQTPLFFVLSVVFCFGISAQQIPFYKDYNWEEKPNYNVEYGDEEVLVALNHKVVTEFVFEAENTLAEYYLEHKTLWLNSDEKIEEYNKVYISYGSSSEIIVAKARVINKDGSIMILSDSKILDATDEESGKKYKYFAFEGIEKGSIIDYYYIIKKNPSYSGSKITLQTSYPKERVAFDLYAPSNLVFDFKSYNTLPSVIQDTTSKDKLHWRIETIKLKGLKEEETSAYNASKGFLVYKLDKNLINDKVDISSYNGVTKRLYNYYYPKAYDKNTIKKLDEFLKQSVDNNNGNLEITLRQLENYIKANVYLSNTSGSELSNLEAVLAKKVANERGILKLYIALFRNLNLKHELVLTSNRQDLKFDKDFEAQNFLTDFLFYFPKYGTYLAPHNPNSRYAFPPAYLTDNYGLFIKEVAIGDFKSGVSKIKYIDPVDAETSTDKMEIHVKFDKMDLTKNQISLDRSMTGYYAMYFQPFMNLVKKEDRDELAEGFAKDLNESVEVNNHQLINDDPSLFGVKPFQVKVDFNSTTFVEKAGNKYLFKVGELIGSQMQIYQDKERVLPVESEFNRSYYRTIIVDIPQGYKVANLDDINIKNSYSEGGMEYFSFNSFYELDGNKLKITADEFYRKNIVRSELYEEYRKVINSAADFNKVTLVLELK
jgi:hypothetical protein